MNRHQMLYMTIMGGILFLVILSAEFFFKQALAAPPLIVEANSSSQVNNNPQFISTSAMAFLPTQPNIPYVKDTQQQLLSLSAPVQVSIPYLFVAPLMLPDRSELVGLTIYGTDFDNQGEVRLRLIRCDHGQARCVSIAETTSTAGYNFGQFETSRINFSSQVIDNSIYNYFLELELSAVAGSGLRSVRMEIIPSFGVSPSEEAQSWSLSGNTLNFTVPNSGYAQVRVCTDDLSHLNNITHYPFVVVDGNSVPLSSNSCVTVWGYDIQISRRPNTGPSFGTYQILR